MIRRHRRQRAQRPAWFVNRISSGYFAFFPSAGQVGQKVAGPERLPQSGGRGGRPQSGRHHLVSANGAVAPLEVIDDRLALKVGKILTSVGAKGLKQLNKTPLTLRKETFDLLKTRQVYVLDPNKKFARAGCAENKNSLFMKNLSYHIPVPVFRE